MGEEIKFVWNDPLPQPRFEKLHREIVSDPAWKLYLEYMDMESFRFLSNAQRSDTWADFTIKLEPTSLYAVIHGGPFSETQYLIAVFCLILKRAGIDFSFEEV